jgi:hypothetical protein
MNFQRAFYLYPVVIKISLMSNFVLILAMSGSLTQRTKDCNLICIIFRASLQQCTFRKYVTCRPNLENSYFSAEVVGWNIYWEVPHMCIEDEEETNRRVSILVHSILLATDSDRRENFTKRDGTLNIHVLFYAYGWKNRRSRSLKEGTSVPDFLQLEVLPRISECRTLQLRRYCWHYI